VSSRAAVIAALEQRIAMRCYEIQVNAHAELVAVTPVDTGFARSNWQPTLDAPAEGTVTALDSPGEPPGEGFDASRIRFVTNNATYIRRLDAGHSAQAPAGFVRAALARAVAS